MNDMKSWIRTAIGITLVIIGILKQNPELGKFENGAWAVAVLTGFVLLVPAIKAIKGRIFKANGGEVAETSIFTVKLFYIGAVMIGFMAMSYQQELHSKGLIFVGKGYSYSISGIEAEQQITACWVGSAASLVIGMILHLRARKKQK